MVLSAGAVRYRGTDGGANRGRASKYLRATMTKSTTRPHCSPADCRLTRVVVVARDGAGGVHSAATAGNGDHDYVYIW